MTNDRITTTLMQVHFKHPFLLPGFEAPHPPGTFDLEVDNEKIDGPSSIAHRHVATFIYLRDGSASRMVSVEPSELAAALERDRQIVG